MRKTITKISCDGCGADDTRLFEIVTYDKRPGSDFCGECLAAILKYVINITNDFRIERTIAQVSSGIAKIHAGTVVTCPPMPPQVGKPKKY